MAKSRRRRFILLVSAAVVGATTAAMMQWSSPSATLPPPDLSKSTALAAAALAPLPSQLALESHATQSGPEGQAEKLLRQAFSEGRFEDAMRLVQEQRRDPNLNPGYKSWLLRQEPVLKLGWGWALIRQKNCVDALPYLEAALAAGEQPLALKGIGFCYLQRKDWWTASHYLDRYLDQRRSDPEAFILLAEAKESLGDYDEALTLTQKANELTTLTPEESLDLNRRKSSLTVKAEEGVSQVEISAGSFLLRYQVNEHQHLVQGALETLQETVRNLNQTWGLNEPAEAIEVIFHKAENFGAATHSPQWASGIYDGRIRIPVQNHQQMDAAFAQVLRHEVTHALLSENFPRQILPTWLQEGLAQVAQCPGFCWNYRFASTGNPFLDAAALSGSFIKLSSAQAQDAYKQSLYLILVLNHQFYGTRGIRQMLDGMHELNDFSSDSILSRISLNFATLHAKASSSWQQGVSF